MPTIPNYPSKVFLNGEILDAENARISVFDRGFIFGDGIYEVMARINGRFFEQAAHMDRLKTCLDKIAIRFNVDTLENAIPALLEASSLVHEDCLLYLQVTRGVAPRQHAFPPDAQPTAMMYAWPKTLPDINAAQAAVILREDFRWSRCDIKCTSLLGNILSNQEAAANDCYETVFLRGGVATEASHCNVFFVRDGIVFTHPANEFILDGITRQVVLRLCRDLGIQVRLEGIPVQEITRMDEAFLTGTSTQVLSISSVDGQRCYGEVPGPVTQRLQQAFLEAKKAR
ncbi:aminotransferase class IV [Robiginitalea sp. SC105]|uniref:aminotransferase class IV n=1 Tax=Robiginitalea sp. SC105 TaxID=2762332 RepID=UPI00163AA730|nr:aminotransferase class IV [Robiginitalea sp. SC105]MBC2839817.1 aminotransferase class IV [Robiginitalea sp. SC105]